jgi:tRNA threonylcarbamoyladenosine biosynthesis protein TsaE
LRLSSRSVESTRAAGAALGRAAGGGLVIALVGDLGAGKTVFAKGIAEGLGLDPNAVQSPTFVIAAEYPLPAGAGAAGGVARLVHADLYRLERVEELEAAGLADWLAEDTLLVVEWADRLPGALPPEGLRVCLSAPAGGAAGDRVLEVEAVGAAAEAALRRWRAGWP